MSSAASPETLADLEALKDNILCDILFPIQQHEVVAELDARARTGFSYISLTMSADGDATPAAVYPRLAKMRYALSRSPEKFILVDGVDDIRRAKKEKKVGVGLHFQGTEPLGRELSNVGAYYALGIRWMLMAYNYRNNVGTGCIEGEKNDSGLSEFGHDVIAEMNRVGMIVDCSHSGYRTTMDAMAASTQPCIFSHSNPRALYDHPRNIRDDQIKACAATGGVIGVNGVGPFIGEPNHVTVETVAKQIDYMVQLVGPEHVVLGLDYMTPNHTENLVASYDGDTSKVALPALPWGFFNPAQVPLLLTKLQAMGYGAEALRGIMGENFLRVAAAVWK